jgi:hypothetical protein
VILELPEYQHRRPYWEYAAVLMNAAQGGNREAIEEAYWQLCGRLRPTG